MTDWQPIETAAQDEAVDVLLFGPNGYDIGHWEPEHYPTEEESRIPAGWWGSGKYWPCDEQPTHWAPLVPPSLPSQEPEHSPS